MKRLRRFARRHWRATTAYVLLSLALGPVSLLGRVHVEAAAVVSAVAFFVSGPAAVAAFRRKERSFARALAAQEALLLVPLLLLTATALWRPQCDYARGLLLFAVMPPVTVAFAVGGAYALTGAGVRHPRTTLVLAGLAVGLGGPLYDLGLHPQFYTYNHLFGGVLGPIYDRELALRPGLFAYRALTLLWALLFWSAGKMARTNEGANVAQRNEGTRWKTIPRSPFPIYQTAVVLAAALIATAYLNSARLGFNTPAWYTQEVLGGHRRTAHFDLYYDPGALSEKQVDRLAEDHEWHYHRLEKRLGAAPPAGERIASYLYPDEETKARLTGARETSVAPVWLDRPQVHLLQSAYAESFGHELVHTFSREFGLPVLNASRSVGLVEGLAVAFEPPHGRPAPADQVSASLFLGENDDEGKPSGLAEGVAARLSPLSFWTGRAAVGYTTMGAFVRFLAQRYGTDKLRAVYAQANFEDVYGTSARALADEWETALLKRRTVARAAGALAERRFSRPSLFEAACPHYVPPFVRAHRAGRSALAAGDTSAARSSFRRALRRKPAFEAARVSAARLLLARDSRGAARRALRLLRAAPPADSGREYDAAAAAPGSAARVVRADAQALAGNARAARRSYDAALERLPLFRHEARALVVLRRALAGRPWLLGALLGGTPAKRARRLAAHTGSRSSDSLSAGTRAVATVLQAVQWAEADQFGRAARLLKRAAAARLSGEQARGTVRRQRLAWRAQWAHRAGRPEPAQRYARRAARAYRTYGDRDAAARWSTFAAKMRWVR